MKNGLSNLKVETEEQSMKLGEIDGFNVTVTAASPPETMKNGSVRPEFKEVNKYFIWKNDGLWYSINYNSAFTTSGKDSKQNLDISQDNVEKIAKSIAYPEEIKNVNYSVEKEVSTETIAVNIYDKEDLEKAKSLIGFNPKFPLKINEDISIDSASVSVSGDSNIENNSSNYELNNFYSNKDGSITFTEQKSSKDYEKMKNNEYIKIDDMVNDKTEQIKVDKLTINNNEVFKYIYTQKDDNGSSTSQGEYVWEENNIYYSVFFFGNTDNSDEIATGFVNSKPID